MKLVKPDTQYSGSFLSGLAELTDDSVYWAIEIGRLLLTCNADNLASEKTIIKNGGVFESTIDTGQGSPKKRFWVSTT